MFLTIVFASFSTFIIRLRLRWVFFYSMKFQFLWWRRGEMAECVSHQTGVSTLCFFFHLRRPYHFVWQRNKGRLSECWTDHVSQRSRITWRWIYARFIWKAKKFKQTIFTFDFGNSGVVWKIERYSIKSAKQKTLSSKRNERQKRWHAFASLRQIV